MSIKSRDQSDDGAVIVCDEATKIFGDREAVRQLTMQIPRGSIFGFIGPSGCGKTTTIRMMTGVYKPTSGEVRVLGKDPFHFSNRDRARFGYLTQQAVLYPDLTVWENLNFAASLYGVTLFRAGRLNKLLDFVELREDRSKLARELSGGMSRRLALAAAMVHNPELIFLDEPTAGIDPILRRKFWDYFENIREEGRTLFVTTQYVSEAAYCDFVGVMHNGRLLTVNTPEGLRHSAYGGEIVSVQTYEPITDDQVKRIADLEYIRGHVKQIDDRELEITVDEASTAMPLLIEFFKAEKSNVRTIEEKIPAFDDVFVRLIEAENRNVETV